MNFLQYITAIIALIKAVNELISYLKEKSVSPEEFFNSLESTFKEMKDAKTDEEKFAVASKLKYIIGKL